MTASRVGRAAQRDARGIGLAGLAAGCTAIVNERDPEAFAAHRDVVIDTLTAIVEEEQPTVDQIEQWRGVTQAHAKQWRPSVPS